MREGNEQRGRGSENIALTYPFLLFLCSLLNKLGCHELFVKVYVEIITFSILLNFYISLYLNNGNK